jgi:lactate racemase
MWQKRHPGIAARRFFYMMVENRSAQPLSDIQAGLDYPIAGPSLLELAAARKTAAIFLRHHASGAKLHYAPASAQPIAQAGIPIEGFSILIGPGLHRAATEAEIRVIVGAEIASRYRVLNHDAKQPAEHRWLGATANGTPVYIDERFMQADLHITLGFIEQHLMLGFRRPQVNRSGSGRTRDHQGDSLPPLYA